ncbi:collagen alpha-1(I) chain-like [Felis catus]|uniref:collagen alpha-1(I) chain-like n=1 Tax=Felis catus TaxID=9685 RepID=UPI001D1A16D9|nr:collagen alpha-1(I) chain-like [Felis catus]
MMPGSGQSLHKALPQPCLRGSQPLPVSLAASAARASTPAPAHVDDHRGPRGSRAPTASLPGALPVVPPGSTFPHPTALTARRAQRPPERSLPAGAGAEPTPLTSRLKDGDPLSVLTAVSDPTPKFTENPRAAMHRRVIFQEPRWDLAGVPRVLTQLPGPGRKADSASELSGGRCRHAHPPPRRPGAPLLIVPPSTSPAHLPTPPRPCSAPDPVSPDIPATRKGPPATWRQMAPSPTRALGRGGGVKERSGDITADPEARVDPPHSPAVRGHRWGSLACSLVSQEDIPIWPPLASGSDDRLHGVELTRGHFRGHRALWLLPTTGSHRVSPQPGFGVLEPPGRRQSGPLSSTVPGLDGQLRVGDESSPGTRARAAGGFKTLPSESQPSLPPPGPCVPPEQGERKFPEEGDNRAHALPSRFLAARPPGPGDHGRRGSSAKAGKDSSGGTSPVLPGSRRPSHTTPTVGVHAGRSRRGYHGAQRERRLSPDLIVPWDEFTKRKNVPENSRMGRARRSSGGGGAARCPAGGRPVCAARAACGRDEDCPPRPERRGRRGRAGSSIVSASAANGAGPSEREVSVAARRLGSARGPGVCAAGHLAARDPPRPGRPRRRAPAGPGDPPRGPPDPARPARDAPRRERQGAPGARRGPRRFEAGLRPARRRSRSPGRPRGALRKVQPGARRCVPAGAAERGLRKAGPPGSGAGAGARARPRAGSFIAGRSGCPHPHPHPHPRSPAAASSGLPPGRAAPALGRARAGQGASGGSARARAGLSGARGSPPPRSCGEATRRPHPARAPGRPGAPRESGPEGPVGTRRRAAAAGREVLEASGSRRGAVPPPPGQPPLAGGLEGEQRGCGDPSEPPASARALAARPGLGSDAPQGPGEAAFRAQLDPRDGGRRGAEAAGP